MTETRVVVCGGARTRVRPSLRLGLDGPRANVALRIGGWSRAAVESLPDALVDLLELACFVHCADQQSRSTEWRRRFRVIAGVRDPDRLETIRERLEQTLSILTDDEWRFELVRAKRASPFEQHLEGDAPENVADEVVLLSGGLDSFAGALSSIVREGKRVTLVSHRATPPIDPRLRTLVDHLRRRAPEGRVSHVTAWLQTRGSSPSRARSFLLATLAACVAHGTKRSAVRFFENGIVSFGLPISAQAIGARTPRATHPQVLEGYAAILGVAVDNGLAWSTKAAAVRSVVELGAGAMIRETISCARQEDAPKGRTHCGLCAQCIDRRFATLAAGAAAYDPIELYGHDLLTAPREVGSSRTTLESYVRAAAEIARRTDADFFARYGELARLVGHLPGAADENAARIHALHVRHAEEIESVLEEGIRTHARALRNGTLPPTSLLVLALPSSYRASVKIDEAPPSTTPFSASTARRGRDHLVRVLHLSDFHFSARRAWDQDPVLRSLAKDVAARTAEGLRPDLVVLTGDIADRGAADEYAIARRWILEQLLPASGASLDRVLVVPGNHDVDRGLVKRVAQATQRELLRAESQENVAAILGDESERALLLRRHDAYRDFLRALGRDHALPWWSQAIRVRDLNVHVAGMCTSWMSWGDEDKGHLLLSRFQVHSVLEQAEEADLAIALMHHPWDYLAEFDAGESREAVLRRCGVVMRGHLHRSEGAALVRPSDQTLELACGACYAGSKHPNGYQLVELDPIEGRARVFMRTWDGHDWIADRNAYRGEASQGVAEFALRRVGRRVASRSVLDDEPAP